RIRERWERALGVAARGIAGGHVAKFADVDSPPLVEAAATAGETFVAASWFAPGAGRLRLDPGTRRLTHQGETVAALVPAGMHPTLAVDGRAEEITGIRLSAAHELLQ